MSSQASFIEPPSQFLPREYIELAYLVPDKQQEAIKAPGPRMPHRETARRWAVSVEAVSPASTEEASLTVLKVTLCLSLVHCPLNANRYKGKESLDLYFVPSSGTSPLSDLQVT